MSSEKPSSWDILDVFDIGSTIFVSILLIITSATASFVYYKLLFCLPHSNNYTFKLIVFNGIAELMSCWAFLIVLQCTSYIFMSDFYSSLQRNNLYNVSVAIYAFFNGIGLHSALFIALNRLKAVLSYTDKNDFKIFFYISVILSGFFSLTQVIDVFTFSPRELKELNFGSGNFYIPYAQSTNNILYIIYNIQTAIVCSSTLLINITIAVIIFHKRKMTDNTEFRRIEHGLMITSIVSYLFYTVYQINNMFADLMRNENCAIAQCFFKGIAATTPFWCLLIFTGSVRRSVFKITIETSVTTVQSRSNS